MSLGVDNQSSPQPAAKQFGKYYLLERIGAGGMAEVFRAVAMGPEGFQRPLVIKRMLPHLSQDRAFVDMFIDEESLRIRNRVCEGFIKTGWVVPEDKRPDMRKFLPSEYSIDGEGKIRRKG